MMGILMQFQKQKERIIQNKKILSIIHVLLVTGDSGKGQVEDWLSRGLLKCSKN